MRIGFIGAGKVGFSLGRYFIEHGIEVTGYYSQNIESSEAAADFTHTKTYYTIERILSDSDTLFITVPDGRIRDIWDDMANLDIKNKIICHCSGSISSATFFDAEKRNAKVYSVHPLYAISDKYNSWKSLKQAVFTVEGTKDGLEDIKGLLTDCGNKVIIMDGDKKALYHGAAVTASNLAAGLFHLSSKMLERCGFDRKTAEKALAGLFLGNAQAIAEKGPVEALTGPVERNDRLTVEKHFDAFDGEENFDEVKEIYRRLSMELVELAELKHPDREYGELLEVLKTNEKHCIDV